MLLANQNDDLSARAILRRVKISNFLFKRIGKKRGLTILEMLKENEVYMRELNVLSLKTLIKLEDCLLINRLSTKFF